MRLKTLTMKGLQIAALSVLTVQCVMAGDVAVIGTIKQTLVKPHQGLSIDDKTDEKIIQLMRVELSEEGKKLLAARMKEIEVPDEQSAHLASSSYPSQAQVAMNNVPVLDQGRHGTCVTFAVTAALDAAMGKGDYISQLCNLQLGTYLENNGYIRFSGWDGSFPMTVIQQIEQYGVISKEKQRTLGCGGLTEYPTTTEDAPNSFMAPEEYSPLSEMVFGTSANWSNIYWRISSCWTLSEVKTALNAGDRAVFAVLFPRTDLGRVGAVGKHKNSRDTWVLTPEIASAAYKARAGHEMIITGYDDDAIAIDDRGEKHKGLLTLRNSWGAQVGDHGDFYMSYDYFKLLSFDVRRISPTAH